MGENARGKYPPAHELLVRTLLNPSDTIQDKVYAARLLGSMAIPKNAGREVVRALCVGFLLDNGSAPEWSKVFAGAVGSAIQHARAIAGAPSDSAVECLSAVASLITSTPSGEDDKGISGIDDRGKSDEGQEEPCSCDS